MRFTDSRKQNVALLIHSISHNEVNVKMQTGGPLLAGNIIFSIAGCPIFAL